METTITLEHIDSLLDNAKAEEHFFHGGKSLIISYLLGNGFTVDGRAAVVDLNNFDIEIGRKVAREDAANQLWKLEGYLLQNILSGVVAPAERLPNVDDIAEKLDYPLFTYPLSV